METAQLLKFRMLFEQEHQNVVLKINLYNGNFQIQKEDLLDSSDLISRQLEASVQMHLRNREVFYLNKVEQALRRISNGTFGYCRECGNEISIKRLEARPTAVFCIDCKEIQEHEEQQRLDEDYIRNFSTELRLA